MKEIVDKKDLVKHFTDGTRKPAIVGNKMILPKVLDDEGDVIKVHASPKTWYELSIPQVKFLKAYEESNLDLDVACAACDKSREWALRFLKTRNKEDKPSHPYLDEKDKLAEIARVATPEWTKATLAMGVIGEYVAPNEQAAKFLTKLADLNFPRASNNIQINNMQISMPKMTMEQANSLKEFADKLADMGGEEVA